MGMLASRSGNPIRPGRSSTRPRVRARRPNTYELMPSGVVKMPPRMSMVFDLPNAGSFSVDHHMAYCPEAGDDDFVRMPGLKGRSGFDGEASGSGAGAEKMGASAPLRGRRSAA